MASKIQVLQQQLAELTRERNQLAERVARADESDSSMSDVVGYYILNPDQDALWDGELHPTLSAASRSFWDPRTREVESGEGWDIYECRRIQPTDDQKRGL